MSRLSGLNQDNRVIEAVLLTVPCGDLRIAKLSLLFINDECSRLTCAIV